MLFRLLLISFIFINTIGISFGQNEILKLEKINLAEAIKAVETASNLVFNYDPQLLEKYTFEGDLNLNSPQQFVEQLLFNSPLRFEFIDQTVLVFLPEIEVFRICGTLRDEESKAPLSYANIFTADQKRGTQSDENGFFDLEVSGYKNQTIKISYIGYHSVSFTLQEFSQEKCEDISFFLNEALFGDAIIVTDYILDGITEGENYSSIQMDYEKLSKNHSIIEHDILKTAQLNAGITSIDESASNLQIRGGTSDQNLILIEGTTLYDPGHFFGMISGINPFIIDQVKIYKGVFNPSYDNRVGGIIDMSLSDQLPGKFHGGIGTTLTEAHSFFQIPILNEKIGLTLSGRNTLNTFIRTPTLKSYSAKVFQDTKVDDEEQEIEQVLNFHDWNGKLLIRPSDKLLFKVSFLSKKNNFNFDVPILDDEFSSVDDVISTSNAINASVQFSPNPKWSSTLAYSNSFYKSDYNFSLFEVEDNESQIESNFIYNDIRDQKFTFSNIANIDSSLNFQIGYEYSRQEVNFNIIANSIYEFDHEDFNFAESNFHNLFSSIEFKKNKFQFNAGLRSTYYAETQDWVFSPRFNLQKAVNKNLKFKLSAGILHQFIGQLREFGETEIGVNNPVWIINRTETETFQKAHKISGGLIWNYKTWLIDIEAYYNETQGLTTLSPLFRSSVDFESGIERGKSLAQGVDFLIKKRWKVYHSWLNYSLGSVDFNFPEINANPFPGSNDLRHNLSFINTWKFKNFNFSLTYQFRSGLPFSQPSGLLTIYEEDEDDPYFELVYENLNQQNLASYSRLDLGISYKHQFKNSGIKSEVAFSIINLLNRDNQLSRDYFLGDLDEIEDTPEIFFIDKFMLGRTPQLLLRFYW